jgi:hypothetical protein
MELHRESKIVLIAESFPSLARADGVSPWNPNRLDVWASEFGRTDDAVYAARFLLRLWNSDCDWECGRFDAQIAIRIWDRVHRRAFLDVATQDCSVAS